MLAPRPLRTPALPTQASGSANPPVSQKERVAAVAQRVLAERARRRGSAVAAVAPVAAIAPVAAVAPVAPVSSGMPTSKVVDELAGPSPFTGMEDDSLGLEASNNAELKALRATIQLEAGGSPPICKHVRKHAYVRTDRYI